MYSSIKVQYCFIFSLHITHRQNIDAKIEDLLKVIQGVAHQIGGEFNIKTTKNRLNSPLSNDSIFGSDNFLFRT